MQEYNRRQRQRSGIGGGGAVEKKKSSFWQTTLLIVGGIWLYSTFAGNKTEQPQTAQKLVPAPVATLPDASVGNSGTNPLQLDAVPAEQAQTTTVKAVHGATNLHSAEVMNVYRGVIGAPGRGLPETARSQFDTETRALLASGQKFLRCVYRTRDGYVTYDFWYAQVPQAALALRAIDPNADIRFMGLDAFDRCPSDADTALYVRQRMMGATTNSGARIGGRDG
ncbi:MAG: hypothetical protein R3E21_01700 [Caenibius sp.]